MTTFHEENIKIAKILGAELQSNEEPECIPEEVEVNEKNLQKYHDFLKRNIGMPCYLTGREDFAWEEKYVFGAGSKNEYERMKKRKASYTDTFKLLLMQLDSYEGVVFARVKRMSDNKKFTLPLDELKSEDKKSPNYKILEDYSSWIVNY